MISNSHANDFSYFRSSILPRAIIWQFFVLFFQSFLLLVWGDSHFASVLSLYLATSYSLILLFLIFISRRYRLLLLTFVGFSIAPIWFLYLDGLLPIGISHSFSSPLSKQLVSIFTTIFFLFFSCIYNSRLLRTLVSAFPKPIFPSLSDKFFLNCSILSFILPIVVIGLVQHGGSLAAISYSLTAGRTGIESGVLLRNYGLTGTSYNLLQPLIWIFMFTPSFFASSSTRSFFSSTNLILKLISFSCACSVIFFYWLSGDRASLVFVLSPMIIIIISKLLYTKRGFYRASLILTVYIILLLNANQTQLRYRGNMLDKVQTQAVYNAEFDNQFIDSNLYIASLVVERVPEHVPFLGYYKLVEPFVNLVPRFLWSSKPVPHSDPLLFNLFNSGSIVFGTPSLTLSIIGTLYLFGGVFTIVIAAPIFSFIFLYLDSLHFAESSANNLLSNLTMALAFPVSIFSFRSYAAIINPILPLLLVFFLVYLYNKLSRVKRTHPFHP